MLSFLKISRRCQNDSAPRWALHLPDLVDLPLLANNALVAGLAYAIRPLIVCAAFVACLVLDRGCFVCLDSPGRDGRSRRIEAPALRTLPRRNRVGRRCMMGFSDSSLHSCGQHLQL